MIYFTVTMIQLFILGLYLIVLFFKALNFGATGLTLVITFVLDLRLLI